MSDSNSSIRIQNEGTVFGRIAQLNWGLVFLVCLVAMIGFTALYSAGEGAVDPWVTRQFPRFVIGMAGMFIIALTDIRWWYRLAWPAYIICLVLLVIVEFKGRVGMGAQRWIDLGFMQLQPSEVMKVCVVMVLAHYFHNLTPMDVRRYRFLLFPVLIIALPVGLVMLQPDLGTALMIMMAGAAMFFLAGAPLRLFIGGISLILAVIPIFWQFMHAYQKKRVLTFLDPESDPLGAGYHITQSKIALGSGGFSGKGFLQGSQSHLNFLPEKQTDFIFTLWVEEWGFLGGAFLLLVLMLIFLYGLWIADRVRHNFGRFLVMGLIVNFSLYVFINIGMVTGLIPVVGAPLPLISYGGTAMLTALGGFGLIMSSSLYRDSKLKRN